MEHLKKLGRAIYLHLDYDTMADRIKNITTRGVVLKEGHTLLDMYNERLSLYEKYADETLICDNLSVEDVVTSIVCLAK